MSLKTRLAAVMAAHAMLGALVAFASPQPRACSLLPEDYAIYRVAIDAVQRQARQKTRPEAKHVLDDLTALSGRMNANDQALQQAKRETVDNFNLRSRSRCRLSQNSLPTDKFGLLPDTVRLSIFRENTAWDDFYQRYPTSGGFWEVTPIGYDDHHNQAVLELVYFCGPSCLQEAIVVLSGKELEWNVTQISLTQLPTRIY